MRLITVVAAGLFACWGVPAAAQVPSNIVLDYQNDIDGDPDRPQRVRLKAQKDLKMGRMAGIWGTVGGSDGADAVFLGKTPDHARMQFDLSALKNGGVRMIVTAKDGAALDRYELVAAEGENKSVWLALKGRIVVQVMSADPNSMSADPDSMSADPDSVAYALYFWYPGDTVDSLTDAELDRVHGNIGNAKPKMARPVKGAGQ